MIILPLKWALLERERECIEDALAEGGAVDLAAGLLEVSTKMLYRRMRTLGVPAPQRARSMLTKEERHRLLSFKRDDAVVRSMPDRSSVLYQRTLDVMVDE